VIRWWSRKQGEASPLAEEPCWRSVGRWVLVNIGNSKAGDGDRNTNQWTVTVGILRLLLLHVHLKRQLPPSTLLRRLDLISAQPQKAGVRKEILLGMALFNLHFSFFKVCGCLCKGLILSDCVFFFFYLGWYVSFAEYFNVLFWNCNIYIYIYINLKCNSNFK
jgi:hypothetical protein